MQRVTQIQLGFLIILFNVSTTIGFLVGPLAAAASFQSWLALIAANVLGLLIVFPSLSLAKKRSEQSIAHFGEKLVGKWVHVLLLILYCFFFIDLSGIILRQITDFLGQFYLPRTPRWMIAISLGFTVAVAVRSGIEAIFRCATGFFFINLGVMVMTPVLIANELNYDRMIALITHVNILGLYGPIYKTAPWYGEMFFVVFLLPYLAQPQKTFRTLTWASLSSSFIIAINLIICILLFGPNLTGHLTYPVLEMLRFIRIGDFLENLDPLIAAVWISTVFIKLCILFYVPTLILSQLFRLNDLRPVSFSVAGIIVGMSINIARNFTELNYFIQSTWPSFALFVEGTPLLYWIGYFFKARMKSKGATRAE